MQAVWAAGACTVDAVHQVVSRQRDLKEVTIRTVLRRLEHKGYVQHVSEGRAFLYRAVEAPRSRRGPRRPPHPRPFLPGLGG